MRIAPPAAPCSGASRPSGRSVWLAQGPARAADEAVSHCRGLAGRTGNATLTPAAVRTNRILVAGEATAEAWTPEGVRVWQAALETSAHFAPRTAGARVVITGRDGLSVLDGGDGTALWQSKPKAAFGAPLVHGDRLLVGDGNALVALNQADGAPLWRHARP